MKCLFFESRHQTTKHGLLPWLPSLAALRRAFSFLFFVLFFFLLWRPPDLDRIKHILLDPSPTDTAAAKSENITARYLGFLRPHCKRKGLSGPPHPLASAHVVASLFQMVNAFSHQRVLSLRVFFFDVFFYFYDLTEHMQHP